jgi:hypothetical protein
MQGVVARPANQDILALAPIHQLALGPGGQVRLPLGDRGRQIDLDVGVQAVIARHPPQKVQVRPAQHE